MTAPIPQVEWWSEEREAAKPPERITISEWAGKYRVLGRNSAIKGPYQLDMVPFFVPIMDACGDQEIDEVGCCAPAQIGKTDALVVNVSGYYCDQEPSPVIAVLADQDTSEYVNEEKMQVMFEESEHLARLYDPKTFNKDEITCPNGARIDFAWASSIARIATKTCRVTVGDEIDKKGWNMVTVEAGSMSLLRERAISYPGGYKKHIWLSTPTTKNGNITVLMNSFDIVYDWHVPCPECGQRQPLRWSKKYHYGFKDGQYRAEDGTVHAFGQVVWDGGREATAQQIIDTARYCCGECGCLWTQAQKNEAVRKGKMVPRTEPKGNERRVFFRLNRILSLFDSGRLEILVQRWVNIFKINNPVTRRSELQGFVNSTLAEPFEEVVVASTKTKILTARCALPPQVVPQEAVALSAGIDHQKYGFWFVVRAWARDYTSWNIHHGQLPTWDDVEELLFEAQYPVDGEENLYMKIWRAALDTGGGKKYTDMSMTEEAYWWLRENGTGRGSRVWGTKGASRPLAGLLQVGKALDKTPSGKALPGGLVIISLDTNKLKEGFHYRLQQAIEGKVRGAHLHSDTGEEYAAHILAEEKKIHADGTTYWDQIGKRNDLLDCEVLSAAVVDPSWPGGGVNLVKGRVNTVRPADKAEGKTKPPQKKRGGFVNGWKK